MSLALTAATGFGMPDSHAVRELSAGSRPGRRFEPRDERLLDNDLLTLAKHLPGGAEGLIVAREFPGGRGIADVVAMTRWQEPLERRVGTQLSFLESETDCAVVTALSPKQTRTVGSLTKRLGMSEEQLTRRLRSLAATGHVRPWGSGFRRAVDMEPIGHAYALEAKVSDWRQGISQALRYSTWCDAAAVVLLRPPRDLGEVTERCSAMSLGLAVGDRWVVRPRLGRPHPARRLAMSEQWARLITESEPLEALRAGV